MGTQSSREDIERELAEWAERSNELAIKLVAEQPHLHPITATIIAGDLLSAERATIEVNSGVPAIEVVHMVGSFARWDWVMTMIGAGLIEESWLADHICDLWSGCDPDDTTARNFAIWQRMFARKGERLRDGRDLPRLQPGERTIRIFRGGTNRDVARGFAWTTDPKTAARFAHGAGTRVRQMGGFVITGNVEPSSVLAYITGRKESEVIVDPRLVQNTRATAARS